MTIILKKGLPFFFFIFLIGSIKEGEKEIIEIKTKKNKQAIKIHFSLRKRNEKKTKKRKNNKEEE
jgi:hypothetical protein